MATYELNEKTKENVSACVGIPFGQIVNLTLEEEVQLASRRYGKDISFSKRHNGNRMCRGNPLLAKGRIRTIQDVERSISRIERESW